MKQPVNDTIKNLLSAKLSELENDLNADILSYFGPIINGSENYFKNIVEQLNDSNKKSTIYIILTTTGGSATVVERYVSILRKHYKEVHFIVPDYAYSAGTIFCMSGDSIHMNYYSVLGPIDPQVMNKDGKFVPALGYLDKVNELLEKSANNTITKAEFLILKDLDLAELRAYEQAKELTITLLKNWLVKYKFKNWTKHRSNKRKKGSIVTQKEKQKRAEEIADKLSDNKIWKFHGRPINMETLKSELKLEIEDFDTKNYCKNLNEYYALIIDYIKTNKYPHFVHTRKLI